MINVNITFEPMQGMGGGFRAEWISAENAILKAGLDSGGGLGNPLLTLWIERKDSKREWFTCDMRKVLQDAVENAPVKS